MVLIAVEMSFVVMSSVKSRSKDWISKKLSMIRKNLCWTTPAAKPSGTTRDVTKSRLPSDANRNRFARFVFSVFGSPMFYCSANPVMSHTMDIVVVNAANFDYSRTLQECLFINWDMNRRESLSSKINAKSSMECLLRRLKVPLLWKNLEQRSTYLPI